MYDQEGLDCFVYTARAQASSAHANVFVGAVHHGPYALKIGIEDALGLIVRVTDVVARSMTFSAEITCKCHGTSPSSFDELLSPTS